MAIAESCIEYGIGVSVDLDQARDLQSMPAHAALFSESCARALVTVDSRNESRLLEVAERVGIRATRIGETGGSAIDLGVLDLPVEEASAAWRTALPRAL